MTDEELQAIRAEITVYQTHNGAQGDHLILHHIPALLAEVERLREQLATAERVIDTASEADIGGAQRWQRLDAENAAMREIVQAVATDDRLLQNTDLAGAGYCNSCSAMEDYELHTPDCLVTKARALLASEEEQP